MGRRKRMVAVCLLAFSLLSTGCTPQADKPADTTSPLTEISTEEETQTSAEEQKEEKEEIVSLLRNPYLHLAKYPEKCLRPAVAERISQALHALPSTGGLCMLMTYNYMESGGTGGNLFADQGTPGGGRDAVCQSAHFCRATE